MSTKDHIMQRKIGAFEVLIVLIWVELFFGSKVMFLIICILSTIFYFAKKHFGGEFSIAQLQGLFTNKKEEKPRT